MVWEFTRVAGPFRTEGVAWTGDAALMTDIEHSRIIRYDPDTDECDVFRENTNQALRVHCDANGTVYACETGANRVVRYRSDSTTEVLADAFDGVRLNGPSDLALDPRGWFWFSDANWGERGGESQLGHRSVYRIVPSADGWSVERATTDTEKPNAVLVSKDQSVLYVGTNCFEGGTTSELRAYPIEADGRLGDYEVLQDFTPHRGLDGMCLNEDGNIVAVGGWEKSGQGPLVYVFDPSGEVVTTRDLPFDTPTYCTFGGPNDQTLYVTGAEYLYRAETDLTGYRHPM